MDYASVALDFANVVNLIAVLLLMRAIIKDRKVLRGISVSGSFLTFVAILGFEVAYVILNNIVAVTLGLVSLTFWFTAFVLSLRLTIHDRMKSQSSEK